MGGPSVFFSGPVLSANLSVTVQTVTLSKSVVPSAYAFVISIEVGGVRVGVNHCSSLAWLCLLTFQ